MKRVLIFAYEFPPYNSIASHRPESWFRYFKENGWHPVIVTRHWNPDTVSQKDYLQPSSCREITVEEHKHGTILRVPFIPNLRDKLILRFGFHRFVLLRLFLTFFYTIFEHVSFAFDRDAPLYKAALDYCSENKVDVILATGNPFIVFRYAYLLGIKTGIPYALDYRDGWTTHQNTLNLHRVLQWVFRNLLPYFEKKYVQHAKLLTVASPSYIARLKNLHQKAEFNTIYNGFFSEGFIELSSIKQNTDIFTIGHGGSVYEYQRYDMFLDGLEDFIKRTGVKNIQVLFLGVKFYPQQHKLVVSYKPSLLPHIELTDRLPYPEALRRLKSCNALLLLASRTNVALASKLYDYLLLNRRILLVENDHDVLNSIIEETTSGSSCESVSEVSSLIESMYSEFVHIGSVASSTKGIDFYDRRNQAASMCNLLSRIIS